ncbi:LysR family transcriptional regulator [Clostridium sediminicola]|uniref:LysR family transcriptional regulator n=1 Tax=Clostridium sediminicola TaxID=3114879 RepID=UPI0031F220A0
MHIECFKYFSEVAKAKSISKVATISHISQSALSQQIQRLEESLGYKLLKRSNKGVELTREGEIVKKYSENIMRTFDKMVEDLNDIDKNNNVIRIDSCYAVSTYALPCTLYSMKKKFPYHDYKLTSNFSDTVEQNVLNNICDIGFIYHKPLDNSLSYYKATTDNLVLVSSQDFKIPDEIESNHLLDYPLILLNDRLNLTNTLNSNFKHYGLSSKDLNILFTLDSTESVKSSILNGYGVAFLPYISVKKELYTKQLKEIKINNFSLTYDIYIINKRNQYTSHAIEEFIDYFQKVGKKSFC